ncbi:hypothetical protein [Nocardioides sp.]|uniref:hypothetical protein n=1 Tax=Nocardioides sp. TaxID=35761 RepID=UPI00378338BA
MSSVTSAISLAAAVAAVVSALFVLLQVREMKRQTDLQREIAEAAAQPYVWAGVRVQPGGGLILELVIGNAGPTVATNVRVTVDPPLVDPRDIMRIGPAQRRLRDGLASIAPGHELRWEIGVGPALIEAESEPHHVRIECDGPHGPVRPNEYEIDLRNLEEVAIRERGSLSDVARELGNVTRAITAGRRPGRLAGP